jgi:hypothetical protein
MKDLGQMHARSQNPEESTTNWEQASLPFRKVQSERVAQGGGARGRVCDAWCPGGESFVGRNDHQNELISLLRIPKCLSSNYRVFSSFILSGPVLCVYRRLRGDNDHSFRHKPFCP